MNVTDTTAEHAGGMIARVTYQVRTRSQAATFPETVLGTVRGATPGRDSET